jgi:hypothetical protein
MLFNEAQRFSLEATHEKNWAVMSLQVGPPNLMPAIIKKLKKKILKKSNETMEKINYNIT